MSDAIAVSRLTGDEPAGFPAGEALGQPRSDSPRRGEDALYPIEAAELGDVAGKRVLHLQCHTGSDTLSLARRGARATGLDFSRKAVETARRAARGSGLAVDFVLGSVEQAPALTPGPFDLVFTTWGTICWLPELTSWARAIAAVLAEGGELYLADAHPAFLVLEERDGRIEPAYDFATPADMPLTVADPAGEARAAGQQAAPEWIHPMSAIVGALIAEGLAITGLREHEALPWRALPCMIPAEGRLWRLPLRYPRLPLAFSLRARKSAAGASASRS